MRSASSPSRLARSHATQSAPAVAPAIAEHRSEETGEAAERDENIEDGAKCCPDCERPNQFGELCPNCESERGEAFDLADRLFGEEDELEEAPRLDEPWWRRP